MDRKTFFNHVKEDYYNDLSITVEQLGQTVVSIAPVFGELKTEIIEKEDGHKQIKFIDVDKADMVIVPKNSEIDVESLNKDMSTVALNIHVNAEDKATIVEHNFGIFTPRNKDAVLFYAGLIGKKIIF